MRFVGGLHSERIFFIKAHPAGVEYDVRVLRDKLGGFKVLDMSESKLHQFMVKFVERG